MYGDTISFYNARDNFSGLGTATKLSDFLESDDGVLGNAWIRSVLPNPTAPPNIFYDGTIGKQLLAKMRGAGELVLEHDFPLGSVMIFQILSQPKSGRAYGIWTVGTIGGISIRACYIFKGPILRESGEWNWLLTWDHKSCWATSWALRSPSRPAFRRSTNSRFGIVLYCLPLFFFKTFSHITGLYAIVVSQRIGLMHKTQPPYSIAPCFRDQALSYV